MDQQTIIIGSRSKYSRRLKQADEQSKRNRDKPVDVYVQNVFVKQMPIGLLTRSRRPLPMLFRSRTLKAPLMIIRRRRQRQMRLTTRKVLWDLSMSKRQMPSSSRRASTLRLATTKPSPLALPRPRPKSFISLWTLYCSSRLSTPSIGHSHG